MCSSSIFPNFQKNVPHIELQILLYVNYAEDIKKFSLVSNSWKHFINASRINNPAVKTALDRKCSVEAWTKHKPQRKPVQKHLTKTDTAQVYGDHIFICHQLDHDSYYTRIYRNLMLIGTGAIHISSNPGHYCDTIIPCGDYFVQLQGIEETYPDNPPTLAVYGRREEKDLEFVPCQLRSKLLLEGREILGLKAVGNKVILICAEMATSDIVFINVLDGSETAVHIPGLYPIDHQWDLYRFKHMAIDEHSLTVLWSKRRMMQLLDYHKGEELWTCSIPNDVNEYLISVVKAKQFTCIYKQGYERRIIVFDNLNGHLISCFSLRRTTFTILYQVTLTSKSVIWSRQVRKDAFKLSWFDVKQECVKTSSDFIISPCSSSCHGQRQESDHCWMQILGLVHKRVLVAECICLCQQQYLAALDVSQNPPKMRVIELFSRHIGRTAYIADVVSGMVLVKTVTADSPRKECAFELLDFNS